MKAKPLDNQLAFELFEQPKEPQSHEPPNYAQPCPIREWCGAYHCETGGCDGQRGWCHNAQDAFTPGKCVLETRRYKSKSFCKPLDRYTNCREVGHCVYMDCSGNAL